MYTGGSFIRDLNYLPKKAPLEYVQTTREDVFPRSTHDPTFRWKENRMSVRNGHVYGCMGFPFPLRATTSGKGNIPPVEKSPVFLIIPPRFPFLSSKILVFFEIAYSIA